ncbi:hypothetical protein N7501_010792 [Penicillium viridicatum]|nr:hypothetical protein N7501_010792 [Penicillium viridicatum]
MSDEKQPPIITYPDTKTIKENYADVTLRIIEDHGNEFEPLTPERERKLTRKLYLHIVVLVSIINLALFIDKSTLGYAAILGLFEETGISKLPRGPVAGNYLMQRLPLKRFLSGTLFLRRVIIFLHCVATKYGGLVVLRLAPGAVEAVVVPAIEITLNMFFNREEQSFLQPIFSITCLGAPIPAGFISNGLLFGHSNICYPNNPAEAQFLSLEEKVHVIHRVHASHQSSIEQKQFKKSQFMECLLDPGSWLFALQAFTLMYANNLNYGQQNLLTTSLGVSDLGAVGITFINWSRKLPLLVCMVIAENTYGITYIIALGWTTSSAAGYTKRLTRNAMFMFGYSIGNLVSPQIWVPSAAPRYYDA